MNMKNLLVLAAFLSASSALARDPKVGDRAVLEGDVMEGLTVVLVREITKANPADRTAEITSTISMGKDSRTQTEDVTFDDLITADSVATLQTGCEGTFEAITVPAGTFDVCTATDSVGTKTSKGMVPFYAVRITTDLGGGDFSLELKEYTFAP
jgi:hypothetical protein